RASLSVPKAAYRDLAGYRAWLDRRARDLALALAADPSLPDRQAAREVFEERLQQQIRRAFQVERLERGLSGMVGKVPDDHPRHADIRVAGEVDVLAVIDALRTLSSRRDLRGMLSVHLIPAFSRTYPDRELTHGFVGHTATQWRSDEDGRRELLTYGVAGLEAAAVLTEGSGAERAFLRDGRGNSYFVGREVRASATPVLHSTLDIELQRAAIKELKEMAEAGARTGKVTIPKWGALVLVEIASGDVVAAASWHRGIVNSENASFAPYQSLFEPGSIVKPLVLAYAYEAGVLDWDHVYDCRPGGRDYREQIGGLGRRKPVRDDHDCEDLTAHGILVNSSNVGASLIGLGLDRDRWQDYMRYFGFGASLDLPLPNGRSGGWPRQSFDRSVRERSFQANSAISFSFGYEFQVTAMHMARAYLRLLRGNGAELRVCRGIEFDGRWLPAPTSPIGASFSPRVLQAVCAAMADVMGPDPKATGSAVRRRIQSELGIDLYGLVAGKTGTAASVVGIPGRGKVNVRNASFVGVIPAELPRWLAVCVLQKDDSARFYGGSYAAPAAVRLLLQAQKLATRRSCSQEVRPSGGQTR
ncbi:MAG: hypothetical protein KDC98_01230, partial [Planctomycetes bacterium]|nr:hypothetical protein [Planctomycetota bacterium]